MPYAELHAHSNFSFLDGASHIEELVLRARELGYEAPRRMAAQIRLGPEMSARRLRLQQAERGAWRETVGEVEARPGPAAYLHSLTTTRASAVRADDVVVYHMLAVVSYA